MNKISIINRVKYSKQLYALYYHIGCLSIRLLKLFLKTDDKLIVFSSFGGRKYDDSPKSIYEAMLEDSRFNDCKLVWAFINPENYELNRGKKVRIDTLEYYKTLLKARIWVTNSSMTRGLNFTAKNAFQLNSWHGSAIKRMGDDINNGNSSFGKKVKVEQKGVMLAQGIYDMEVFSHAFNIPKENFRMIGLPRNDVLAQTTKDKQTELKIQLGIPREKKAILYAPTFREYDKDGGNNVIMTPPIDFKVWEERLSNDYVLLFRAHYEVAKMMGVVDSNFLKNVSTYPSLNDLMLASDMLISDYSSIFFDYAIQGKPMLCYCYDYDKYAEERGVYFDIREWLPSATNENDLLSIISSTVTDNNNDLTKRFQRKFVTEYGHATEKSLEIIYEQLQKNYE